MTDTPDQDLSIRSSARPIKSFSKRVIFIALGGAGLLIFASISMASGSASDAEAGVPEELYSTTHKATADGLAALPTSYADLEEDVRPIPKLGPPLPGDLGGPILRAQQEGVLLQSSRRGFSLKPDREAPLVQLPILHHLKRPLPTLPQIRSTSLII